MPRPRSGLNVVRKKLPDGTVREYFYDRKTGAFIGHNRTAALARVVETPVAADGVPPGSLADLIVEYLSTSKYRELSPRTRKLYRGYLDLMRGEWGDLPIRGIRRGTIQKIKTRFEATPRKANQVVALFRILLKLAVDREYLSTNPAAEPGMLATPARVQIWTHEDEDEFLDAAWPSIRLAFLLMLYTIQRPSDVLAMSRNHVSEKRGRLWIALRQQKTAQLLDVPVHARLEGPMRERLREKTSLLLVPSPRGKPWGYRNFSRAWDAALRRMALRRARRLFRLGWSKERVRTDLADRHRQRRDLRRTGIVRLAEAGATTPQIAALSGHSIDYCQRIIDTYLPRRTEVALGGIEAWERAGLTAHSPVVSIAAVRPKQK
jgi:integrase